MRLTVNYILSLSSYFVEIAYASRKYSIELRKRKNSSFHDEVRRDSDTFFSQQTVFPNNHMIFPTEPCVVESTREKSFQEREKSFLFCGCKQKYYDSVKAGRSIICLNERSFSSFFVIVFATSHLIWKRIQTSY